MRPRHAHQHQQSGMLELVYVCIKFEVRISSRVSPHQPKTRLENNSSPTGDCLSGLFLADGKTARCQASNVQSGRPSHSQRTTAAIAPACNIRSAHNLGTCQVTMSSCICLTSGHFVCCRRGAMARAAPPGHMRNGGEMIFRMFGSAFVLF